MRYKNLLRRCLVCWLVLLNCGAAFSQNVPPDTQKSAALYSFKKNQRIRLEKSDGSVIAGRFRAIKDDTLLLNTGTAQVMAISISDLQSLWISTNSARVGGRVGAILGAIPGAIVGVYMASMTNIDCESHCVDLTGPHLIGGAIGGLVGAAGGMTIGGLVGAAGGMTIGSIIGAAIPQWQRVYP